MANVYLSDRQLAARYNVHHLTPRRWMRDDPSFPRPVRLSPGCSRWRLSDIEAWEASKTETAA
jgi:predicted DNA-binding transcriptional regulator AlpA